MMELYENLYIDKLDNISKKNYIFYNNEIGFIFVIISVISLIILCYYYGLQKNLGSLLYILIVVGSLFIIFFTMYNENNLFNINQTQLKKIEQDLELIEMKIKDNNIQLEKANKQNRENNEKLETDFLKEKEEVNKKCQDDINNLINEYERKKLNEINYIQQMPNNEKQTFINNEISCMRNVFMESEEKIIKQNEILNKIQNEFQNQKEILQEKIKNLEQNNEKTSNIIDIYKENNNNLDNENKELEYKIKKLTSENFKLCLEIDKINNL